MDQNERMSTVRNKTRNPISALHNRTRRKCPSNTLPSKSNKWKHTALLFERCNAIVLFGVGAKSTIVSNEKVGWAFARIPV